MDTNTPEVIYIAEKVGPVYRGLVIDQRTQVALARTGTYVSAETAKSAAASLWRAKLAGGHGVAPSHIATLSLLYNCSLDRRTVRNVRELIPSLRADPRLDAVDVEAAIAAFEPRVFEVEGVAA